VLQPPYGLAITHSPLEAAHDVAQSLGTHAIPLLSKSQEDQHRHLAGMLRSGTNGFILWPLPQTPVEGLLRQFRAHGVPFVLCDLDLGPFDFVGVDNEQGTRLAVEHLYALGHRRIMYITQSLQIPSLQRRRDGYVHACMSRGLRRAARSVVEIESATELTQIHIALDAFRGEFRGATGAVFSNDWAAIYFMRLAREAGIRVPEDISVVGFDGIDAASITTPGLTTVEQNFHHTGVVATQLLFHLIEDQRKGRRMPPYRLRVEPQLMVRQSTARRRA
jgi:DNA-binding LacI/PurR family transcriptional regulator